MLDKVILNLQAALVLAGGAAAWIFVPPEILMPIAAVVLAIAVAGVFALKALMRRAEAGRRALLTHVAMALALLGFVAFLVLVLEYAD